MGMWWEQGWNKETVYSSIPLRKKEVLVSLMNLKLNFDINLEPRNEQPGVPKVSYSSNSCTCSVMDIRALHNPFYLQAGDWTIHYSKTFYEWLIWGSQMYAGTHVLSFIAPHHQPGTIVSTGNRAMNKLDTVFRYMNSVLDVFSLPAQRANDTCWWYCSGRLWNLYKVKLCWRKDFTLGQPWGFIAWTQFLFLRIPGC